MHTKYPAAILAVFILLSNAAKAETSFYGGVNYVFLNYEEPGGSVTVTDADGTATVSVDDIDLDFSLPGFRLGAQFHENLSAELRFGFDLGVFQTEESFDARVTQDGSTVTVEVDTELKRYYGGYLRAGVPVGRFYPYLLAGWTNVKLEYSFDTVPSTSNSDSDFSYGLGTLIRFSDDLGVGIEWGKYYDKDNVEISGFQISAGSSF